MTIMVLLFYFSHLICCLQKQLWTSVKSFDNGINAFSFKVVKNYDCVLNY